MVLEVDNLHKTINKSTILKNVSFSITSGTITGIVGRNGAGKTTLLRTMMGILLPDSGDVRYQGKSIYTNPEVKVELIFIPDSKDLLTNYTPRTFAKLYDLIYPEFDTDIFEKRLEQFNLPLDKKIRYFSKGMKALFYLVLAFAARTRVVLLDEPTDGLDPIYKKQCLQLIVQEVAEQNTSVVISSHRLEELQSICDQVIFLKNGTIEWVSDLMTVQERYQKLQVAFDKDLPEEIKRNSNVHILTRSGRVYTLLVERKQPDITEQIKASKPILLELLPLSLEDLFVSKLGGEDSVR